MLKNNKGITLVELLIVIVILGIIAAIAVPAVGNIVENAQRDAFISEGRTIASSANVACTTEEYDGCRSLDHDEWDFLVPGDDPSTGLVADGYLEGFEGEFKAWRSDGTWYVAWQADDYFVAGNPADVERNHLGSYDAFAGEETNNLDEFGEDARDAAMEEPINHPDDVNDGTETDE